MSFKFEPPFDAIIYLEKDQIDLDTFKQISKIIEDPVIKKPRFMPDVHPGTGCCVGFTSELTDKIIPRIIGPDIGCGVLTYCLVNCKFKTGKYEKKFDDIIKKVIPMGNGHDKVHVEPIIQECQYVGFFAAAQETAKKFAERYKDQFGIDILGKMPLYSSEWLKDNLCKKVSSDYEYDLRSMGTLGGSNHFIEVGEEGDNLYFTVHTGSRNIGSKICRYHQDKMDNSKISYLTGDAAYEYYFDMIFAQMYAKMNRKAIMSHMFLHLNINFDLKEENIIESVHNYIDFEDMIIRKGAIPARKDQKCIIALNMRDGIIVCKGKGNVDWNYSAAHGCGRIVTRNKAKRQFTLKKYKEAMRNVYSTSVNMGTIDEAPMAYKDSEMIITYLGPTVEIMCQVKPTLNVKGMTA